MAARVIKDIDTVNRLMRKQGLGLSLIRSAKPMLEDYIQDGCLYSLYGCVFVAHESLTVLPYSLSSSPVFVPARSLIIDRIAGLHKRELLLDNLQYQHLLHCGVKFKRMK